MSFIDYDFASTTTESPPLAGSIGAMMVDLHPLYLAWKWWSENEPRFQFTPRYAGMGYIKLIVSSLHEYEGD